MALNARSLIAGTASGLALVHTTPLSFWGGVDANDGRIVDPSSAHCGVALSGRVLFLVGTRGSSSSSSVLLELLRRGLGPAAIVLGEADAILAIGAVVGRELGYAVPPVLVLPPQEHSLAEGKRVTITSSGAIELDG